MLRDNGDSPSAQRVRASAFKAGGTALDPGYKLSNWQRPGISVFIRIKYKLQLYAVWGRDCFSLYVSIAQ